MGVERECGVIVLPFCELEGVVGVERECGVIVLPFCELRVQWE